MLAGAAVWSLANGLRWRFVTMLILIDGIIPFLYFVHLLRSKEISDWDTTKRTERFQIYGFTIAVHAVGVILAFLLGKLVLAKILFSFWLLAVVFFGVTLIWKISVHAGVFSAAVVFLSFTLDWRWLWLFALVALVGWSRVTMKKHTWSQVTVGAVLAAILLLGSFAALGVSRNDARAPSQGNSYGF